MPVVPGPSELAAKVSKDINNDSHGDILCLATLTNGRGIYLASSTKDRATLINLLDHARQRILRGL